jgi:hypothetical protein
VSQVPTWNDVVSRWVCMIMFVTDKTLPLTIYATSVESLLLVKMVHTRTHRETQMWLPQHKVTLGASVLTVFLYYSEG